MPAPYLIGGFFLAKRRNARLCNNHKSAIHLPRQECGVQGISWHSADTLGHSFPTAECETTNEERKNC